MRRACISWLVLATSVACSVEGNSRVSGRPTAVPPESYRGCFNGAGFFTTDPERLAAALPDGYTPLDGSFLRAEYSGSAMLAMVYFSCPVRSGTDRRWAMIATPIEDPGVTNDLRPVRWNWYEVARLEADPARVDRLLNYGVAAQRVTLVHEPFAEGDTRSQFSASVPEGTVFSVAAALADSVNFEAQSHRFWHVTRDGRLVSTRLDFEYHHSWIGSFSACELLSDLLEGNPIQGAECSGVGTTEAIETIDFVEQVILWN